MKRTALYLLVALAIRGAFAAPEMLAPPRFADPTVMYAFARSNVFEIATAYFNDSLASNFTAVCWMKWTPHRSRYMGGIVPFVHFAVSADSARATREGGDPLPDLQSHRYEVPLTLSNGTWAETCLPAAYPHPDLMSDWQYGCYVVNIETDTALTLNVAGAEQSISAADGMQVFNILGATASRAVGISAASSSARVKFAIAENPLVQFVGSQFDDAGTGSGSFTFGDYGGIVSNEWRMVVCRGRIAAGSMTVNVCGYNATQKFYCDNTTTQELWHPRATFAKNARVRVLAANLSGGLGFNTDLLDILHLYGFRVYRGWFDDAMIERMRDQDVAEMTRRGM